MPEEKKVIPYKVQKGNRPKIEEVIDYCLDGDLQTAALDFAAYMRKSKMPFGACTSSSTRGRSANYKGERICSIFVYAEDDWKYVGQHNPGDAQYWIVTPELIHINKYDKVAINEGLQNILWDNINYCTHYRGNGIGCSPNKRCAGGRDLTILGKEFNGIRWCGSHSSIKNPDEAAIKAIKRLLELEQQARDENIENK